jgi:hypothetical protein
MLGYLYGKRFGSKITSASTTIILHTYPLMKMEQTECSETSAYKIHTSGNYPEENIQHSQQGERLKSRVFYFYVLVILRMVPIVVCGPLYTLAQISNRE